MSDELVGLTGDDRITTEARKRFRACASWESDARKHWLDDVKFAEADQYNQWQWSDKIATDRLNDNKPCLTINKTRQHCLQIINDSKKNKPSVAIRAVNDASYDASQIWEGLIRHIEYQSKAQQAYDTATGFQVKGGIGYWRVTTAYVSDDVFDQEIYIGRIPNPLSVYLDPDIKEFDGSDARFGFIYDDAPKDEFEIRYPKYKDYAGEQNAVTGDTLDNWYGRDYVRVAEYFRKVSKPDVLLSYVEGGKRITVRKSELPKEVWEPIEKSPGTAKRVTTRDQVEWYLIVGDKIVDRRDWPGIYIPIVRLIGEETIIEKQLDRKGHTRAMLDPQRIYNYWSSSAVEHVALQGKTPWVAPAESIEGFETYWETANIINHSILPYNAVDDNGQQLPFKPERAAPPQMAGAYIQGMQISANEIMSVSGQFQTQMGQQGNERSALAIDARNEGSDNSTFHFVDNLGVAIEFTGRILIDLVPKIYDTERVLKVLNEDGTDQEIKIDPNAPQAIQGKNDPNTGKLIGDIVLNPRKGKFAVRAQMGPSYTTKRQATFQSIATLLTQSKELTPIIGDIMLRAADFPLAAEAAERLKRMVPKEALGEGPSQKEQALGMQVQQLEGLLAKAIEDLGTEKRKSESKDQLRLTDAYDAETKRLNVVKDMLPMDPAGLQKLVRDTISDALGINLDVVRDAALPGLKEEQQALPLTGGGRIPDTNQQPPHPTAQKGQDGHWYMPNPSKPGSWARVEVMPNG